MWCCDDLVKPCGLSFLRLRWYRAGAWLEK